LAGFATQAAPNRDSRTRGRAFTVISRE